MDEQNSLAKQNKIISMFEKNEKKMKQILLAIIICVISFSSIMSLTYSYKSYKEVKKVMNKEEIGKESFSYETLVVSYSSGSLLNCNDSGCGSTIVNVFNDGDDSVFYNVSFVDISGDGTYYNYSINDSGNKNVPSSNTMVMQGLEIKPGESKDYKISLNSNDSSNHENYQMRLQVNLETDKNLFLE